MEIIKIILSIIIGLYGISRMVDLVEPTKTYIDKKYFKFNQFLIFIKDSEVKTLLCKIAKLLSRISSFGILGLLLLVFFMKETDFFLIIGIVVFGSALLGLTINWIFSHKETVIQLFLNFFYISILLSPFIFLLVEKFLNVPVFTLILDRIPELFILPNQWITALILTLFNIIILGILPYIFLWLISIPLLFVQFVIIFSFIRLLKLTYKYVHHNLLDILVGLVTIIISVF